MLKLLDNLKGGFIEYAKEFDEVERDWEEIGLTQKDGLLGEMAVAINKVEEVLVANNAAVLDEILAQMVRREKDFLLSEDAAALAGMDQLKEAFEAQLTRDTQLPFALKAQVKTGFEDYFTKMKSVSLLMKKLHHDEILMEELYVSALALLVKLVKDGEEDLQDATADLEAISTSAFKFIMITMVVVTLVVFGLAVMIGRGISRPISNMTDAMQTLADGHLEVEIPAQDYGNEIGTMAAAVQVFKDNAIAVKRMEAEQKANEERTAREKREMMLKMADDFEQSIGGVVDTVSSAATQMQSSATSLSSTAEETSKQSTTVAAASEQASTNVQTVASASEELSSSISEISRQVAKSTQISDTAVEEVDGANDKVKSLAQAAQKIGEVVALITDIADQTNLLALNATIEAARAGDAGKGFAVVASEVKNLANQTAKATEEISSQIGGIQDATQDAVQAIGSIGGIINQMNEISSTIAAAVEEQGAATSEIARNVEQAAQGTGEVSANIASVTQAASETGAAAEQMLGAAQELSQQSVVLRGEVDSFLSTVRNG
ncbi:MAG: HAMP domain-containing protein [Magnetovibrio sp.]|nr:HAMP domain-containing protein [Magnetovibrio sp.]